MLRLLKFASKNRRFGVEPKSSGLAIKIPAHDFRSASFRQDSKSFVDLLALKLSLVEIHTKNLKFKPDMEILDGSLHDTVRKLLQNLQIVLDHKVDLLKGVFQSFCFVRQYSPSIENDRM